MNLAELQAASDRTKKRLRDRYRFAARLGFSAAECKILRHNSEANIRKLAAEKKKMEGK